MSRPTPPRRRQLLWGWGRRPVSAADVVVARDEADVELSGVGPRGALARGLGRSYGDAALNAGGVVYDLTRLTGIRRLDPEAGTVTVAAGTSIDALLRALVPLGWFVPVTPGTRMVTVGGAIAADVHGKNHHRDGSFTRHVRSLRLIPPADGPREVTPDSDPELFAATAGGMGLTGIITEATFELVPIRTSLMRVDTERAKDLDDALARMTARDDRYRYAVAWIDLLARGRSLGRSVLTRGDHAEPDDLEPAARHDPLRYAPSTRLRVPPGVPSGLLTRAAVRVFNEAWYAKARRREGQLLSIPAFFHPLDGVAEWNRAYGARGFLQYQLVVPFGQEATLRAIVERLAAAQAPSFLTVLKRFGRGDVGHLSFPLPGWTLTLDLPLGMPGLARMLAQFDEQVAEAGGRVYLAKDSRLSREVLRAMYPRLDAFRAVRDRVDPDRVLVSDLARRLQL